MAILFRDKKPLGPSVLKVPLEGEPDSVADDISLEDLFEHYKKLSAECEQATNSGRRPVDVFLSGALRTLAHKSS